MFMKFGIATAALMFSLTAGQAQTNDATITKSLTDQGFTDIEIRRDLEDGQLEVEAWLGEEKVEITYDLSTGNVVKSESERVTGGKAADDAADRADDLADAADDLNDADDSDDDVNGVDDDDRDDGVSDDDDRDDSAGSDDDDRDDSAGSDDDDRDDSSDDTGSDDSDDDSDSDDGDDDSGSDDDDN